MITTVLFDFFDVLCPDDYKAWLTRQGLKKEGDFLAVSEQLDHGNITTEQFFARLAELSNESVDELRATFIAEPTIDQDVLTLILNLRNKYKVGLISNAPSEFLREILQKYKLEQHFDTIVISSEVGMIKPQPEIFAYALHHLASTPPETIFIDDNKQYVTGAVMAGLRGITFLSAEQLAEDLKKHGVEL